MSLCLVTLLKICHIRYICKYDCRKLNLCVCVCVFSHVVVLHTLRNLEVLVYLCICKSDTKDHCFRGPLTITFSKRYGLYGLKHHTVEIIGGVTRRDDDERTTNIQWKIELLSLWAVGRHPH